MTTFQELKETTARDCEAVAGFLTALAAEVREGNFAAFEEMWIEGGTEEGDAKILEMRERIVMRYIVKSEDQRKGARKATP